jgi:hypothetical protein
MSGILRKRPANQMGTGLVRNASESSMKLKLEITKAGRRLHEGVYEVDDNATFGAACADAWVKIREQCAARATSIGALMDSMHESVVDELDGAQIKLKRL